MSLAKTIFSAQIDAMKQRKKEELEVIRMLTSAIKYEQIESGEELDDAAVEKILKRYVKQLKDALGDFDQAGRADLSTKTKEEIAIVSRFLPVELSDDDLREIVVQTLASLSSEEKSNEGRVMGAVMKAVSGRADGTRVRNMVTTTVNS